MSTASPRSGRSETSAATAKSVSATVTPSSSCWWASSGIDVPPPPVKNAIGSAPIASVHWLTDEARNNASPCAGRRFATRTATTTNSGASLASGTADWIRKYGSIPSDVPVPSSASANGFAIVTTTAPATSDQGGDHGSSLPRRERDEAGRYAEDGGLLLRRALHQSRVEGVERDEDDAVEERQVPA